jgi:membrane protease YdiL (CAAX protease family)
VRDVLAVYAAAFVATAALGAVDGFGWLDDVAQLGIAAVFLGVPLRLARRDPGGAERFGIALAGLLDPGSEPVDVGPPGPLGLFELGRALRRALPSGLRETAVALGIAAVIFPPFVVAFWWWHGPAHPWTWRPPDDLASFVVSQLVLVGLPEEAFFRGFVQTRLDDAWPRTVRLLGADVSLPALLVGSILFGLVHLAADPHVNELATFFPGLLFGWLRARRGGIGAAIVLHAVSNVLAEIRVRGWL